NEGKFYALETENTIVLLAAGQDYTLTDSEEQELGCDYLQENRSKLQAIIINNTSFRNI
ncbi:3607_t:CDS:1, partial [Racocetra persica]